MTEPPRSTGPLAHYLRGLALPSSREQIVEHARGHGASEASLAAFAELPEGQYGSMAEIFAGVREEAHRRAMGHAPEPVAPPRPAPAAPPPEEPSAMRAWREGS